MVNTLGKMLQYFSRKKDVSGIRKYLFFVQSQYATWRATQSDSDLEISNGNISHLSKMSSVFKDTSQKQ